MNDWHVIVEPVRPETADELFAKWKNANPFLSASLAPEDIRIDTIRSADGTLRRYLIRKTMAPGA